MSAACTCAPGIRSEARFAGLDLEPIAPPVAPPAALTHAALLVGFQRSNAAANPLPICSACGYPTHPNDMEWLFHSKRCISCAMDLVDKLLYKAARKHGRKKALKLLKRLAK
jgi:hypothetical protein